MKVMSVFILFFIANKLARMSSLLFSPWGPVITLNQRAPKAQIGNLWPWAVWSMRGWIGWSVGGWLAGD